jgi:hypothetical protein
MDGWRLESPIVPTRNSEYFAIWIDIVIMISPGRIENSALHGEQWHRTLRPNK